MKHEFSDGTKGLLSELIDHHADNALGHGDDSGIGPIEWQDMIGGAAALEAEVERLRAANAKMLDSWGETQELLVAHERAVADVRKELPPDSEWNRQVAKCCVELGKDIAVILDKLPREGE